MRTAVSGAATRRDETTEQQRDQRCVETRHAPVVSRLTSRL